MSKTNNDGLTPAAKILGVGLSCKNLGYTINGKSILKGINLIVEPGEMLAVVGPSGAGKTTLLNCLSFRFKNHARSGAVYLNGEQATPRTMQRVCNYVMTDGRMLPYLTVHEALMLAANLKLPFLSKKERATRVDKILFDLGLQNCRDTYIGGEWKKGISTGERKRVCIAMELLANPSILILDEPTNGLDSTLACELLEVLKNLAKSGRTVILSLHQPSSQIWSMLDQLLIITRGQSVYFGSANDATDYFARNDYRCPKNYNPADFFLCLISSDPSGDYAEESGCSNDYPGEGASAGTLTVESSLEDIRPVEIESNLSNNNPPQPLFETLHGKAATIRQLITAFETSKENDVLKKRIDVQWNFMAKTVQQNGQTAIGDIQKESFGSMAFRWTREVEILCKRSFVNSIRNPIVCCVMLLVQTLQGLILGGIFWQLASQVANQQPYHFDTKALVDSPWAQLFIHGIDGKQPILEFFEHGIDNRGSQPIVDLFSDSTPMVKGYNIMTCGIPAISQIRQYPTFDVRPTHSWDITPAVTLDDIKPLGVAGATVGMAQVFDHLYLRHNWTNLANLIHGDALTFYTYLLDRQHSDIVIFPWMKCADFPVSYVYNPNKRKLITIGDIGVTDALVDFLGVGGKDMVTATKDIFQRLQGCKHQACQWLHKKTETTYDLGKQAYDASMAVVNILGALFFAVANLGFASYDALLTFPQERALFNRESANGLYFPSSYFIAKNIADLPFQLVPTFALITLFYFMAGLGLSADQYFIYLVTCMGVTFSAYGFGYLVSAISPRMEISVLIAPVILVIWLTIAGFFLRDSQIPAWIGWLSYFSFYKWGFFSLVANQFPENGFFGILPNRIPLIMAGITDTRIWSTTLLLLCLGLVYRVLAFLALKYTNRSVGLSGN